jgi:hypothetical protein
MKNDRQKLILGGAIAMLVLFGVSLVAAQGFRGGMSDEDHAAMQEAIESGDYEAWSALGQKQFSEERFAERQARHAERAEHRAAMDAVLDSGDYDAWVAFMEENPRNPKMAEVITEDNFDTFVRMHEAKENGDFETAQALASELGLGAGRGMGCDGSGQGFGKGAGQGTGQGKGNGMRMHGF